MCRVNGLFLFQGIGSPAYCRLAGSGDGRPKGDLFSSPAPLFRTLLAAVLAGLIPASQAVAHRLAPPPRPLIAPFIADTYRCDADADRIDDALMAKLAAARSASAAAAISADRVRAKARLRELIDVELIFRQPVTQRQIDDFIACGGRISYIYKAVSYGWNGRIPLDRLDEIPSLMGTAMALVEEAGPAVMHLDIATRSGRIRPVWTPGFAGNISGFHGGSSITIAVVDSGIDANHADLAGRGVYWNDFTADGRISPSDIPQHGSHVSGVALGTGAAGGSTGGPLHYTDIGDLTSVVSGNFNPSPVTLPEVPVTFTSVAQWTGGGSTSLYQLCRPAGVYSGWTALSSPVTGFSPQTLSNTFTPSADNVYSPALLSNSGAVRNYVVANSVSDYPAVGDGFNTFRGVAPGCNWAAAKVFDENGESQATWIGAAVDDLVANRVSGNIKVMNLSLGISGDPGINVTLRQKVNSAVNNGIVVMISAGNDGLKSTTSKRQIDDPGRAAMALTVAAANDRNRLTAYSSHGFGSPDSESGREEDCKPDIVAPGGSLYYTRILSVDSGSGDGAAFADRQSDDYYSLSGTSMASPFAAGAAALVIEAMQRMGVVWDFSSSRHSRYVKMLLCATASETYAGRENNSYNPTLQRDAAGPSGFPAGKDLYEGYGMINPDAAVEAAALVFGCSCQAAESLGPDPYDRRVWARAVPLAAGAPFRPRLEVPASADFDLYLYNAEPGPYGTPVILASGTNAGDGIAESLDYTPENDANALLVVKRVSGSGTFTLIDLASHKTISASAGDGGTVEPAPTVKVDCGGDAVFIASPDPGYQIDSWYLDGNSVQAGGSEFLLTNVTSDYNVSVRFGGLPQIFISGRIANDCGVPVDGVIVEAIAGSSDISDANGLYEVWSDPDFSEVLVLNKPYYTFAEVSSANKADKNEDIASSRDFTAWHAYDYDCSGDIAWGDAAALADNWLTVSGAVPDANDDALVNFLEYARFSDAWQTEYGK